MMHCGMEHVLKQEELCPFGCFCCGCGGSFLRQLPSPLAPAPLVTEPIADVASPLAPAPLVTEPIAYYVPEAKTTTTTVRRINRSMTTRRRRPNIRRPASIEGTVNVVKMNVRWETKRFARQMVNKFIIDTLWNEVDSALSESMDSLQKDFENCD